MQLLTLLTVSLSAITTVVAAPQGGFNAGKFGTDIIGNRIGGTNSNGKANANAGSTLNNNGNTSGGNTAIGNPGSVVNQASTSCNNGQVVCCNGPTSNSANAKGVQPRANIFFPQYQFLIEQLYAKHFNTINSNNNQKETTSNQCNGVTSFDSGSASPMCQQTAACCSGNESNGVANVGCTAINVVVNTGSSPVKNFGFFPKA